MVGIGVTGVDYVATVDHFPAPDEKMRSTSLAVWTPHPPAPGVGGVDVGGDSMLNVRA